MALPLHDPNGDDDSRTPVVEKRTTILSTAGPLSLVLVGGARREAAPGAVATAACRRRRKADRIMLHSTCDVQGLHSLSSSLRMWLVDIA